MSSSDIACLKRPNSWDQHSRAPAERLENQRLQRSYDRTMPELQMRTSTNVGSCRQAKRRLLRTKEAAAYLGLSSWKLRQLVLDGALPYINAGDRAPWRFDLCDLEAYIERSKQRENVSLVN